MIRFQSKAGADILMLQAHADAVLAALGRECAPSGIFEGDGLAAALNHWDQRPESDGPGDGVDDDAPGIGQRAWPLLQMLRRAQDARVPVIWSSS